MSIAPGAYRIYCEAARSTARSYRIGETIFVSATKEFPGPFELWQIETAIGGYTIKNLGLNAYCHADPSTRSPVNTIMSPDTIFEISKEDERNYVIKLAYEDLVWTVDKPVFPRGDIMLQRAQGWDTQKFQLQRAMD